MPESAAGEVVAAVLACNPIGIWHIEIQPADAARIAAAVLRWAGDNLTACPWSEPGDGEHGCDWPFIADRLYTTADEIDGGASDGK
jgi:hypothetical protein